jgi:two-component system sensor histidine kinase PilS (NtrC family)
LRDTSIFALFPEIDGVIKHLKKKTSELSSNYQRYETLLTHHDGGKTHLGFSISPLPDPEGTFIGHTLIFQDITKFKEMEDQMKRVDKMAAVGVLAAGMAHEIRNPLASLSGSIQMLKSELTLNDYQQHLMDITLRESERLNSLITDFLLFAHPPQTHKILCSIRRILEETIDLFIHSPSFHDGIRIFRPNGHDEVRVSIDPDQMKQVFWNLFINAAQAITEGGDIRIQLGKEKARREIKPSLSSEMKGREWLKISIIDSGNGISPEQKEKIFEPFFTTKETGTGLGLSIVHKIIENHDGLIKVESEMGRGATFSIFLPAD